MTGVDDPYEIPTDADLVIDTSTRPVGEAASMVLEHLVVEGWLDRPYLGSAPLRGSRAPRPYVRPSLRSSRALPPRVSGKPTALPPRLAFWRSAPLRGWAAVDLVKGHPPLAVREGPPYQCVSGMSIY